MLKRYQSFDKEKLMLLEKFINKTFALVYNSTHMHFANLCTKYQIFKSGIVKSNVDIVNKIEDLIFCYQILPEENQSFSAAELVSQQYNIKIISALRQKKIEIFKQEHLTTISTISSLNNNVYNMFSYAEDQVKNTANVELCNYVVELKTHIVDFFTKIDAALQKYNGIFIQNTIELERSCLLLQEKHEDIESVMMGQDIVMESFLNDLVS